MYSLLEALEMILFVLQHNPSHYDEWPYDEISYGQARQIRDILKDVIKAAMELE